jgi:hypothetical protein
MDSAAMRWHGMACLRGVGGMAWHDYDGRIDSVGTKLGAVGAPPMQSTDARTRVHHRQLRSPAVAIHCRAGEDEHRGRRPATTDLIDPA